MIIESGSSMMHSTVIGGSKVDVGIAITAKKLVNAESHIDGMTTLMRKMEASTRALDEEITGFVTNVTLLEVGERRKKKRSFSHKEKDVAALLKKVNEESKTLYENLGNSGDQRFFFFFLAFLVFLNHICTGKEEE
jgi:hypothetical protein